MPIPPDAERRFAAVLAQRPLVVAVAGPNGAGKTTFHHAHLAQVGLRFVNADVLAGEFGVGAYEAAAMADGLRRALVRQRESFVFETVLSDPHGAKLDFLAEAAREGYTVVLCFIGISSADRSDERVAMRVTQGGHDVPTGKLMARYPRTMANLASAVTRLPHVFIFDNDDLGMPYRFVALYADGTMICRATSVPDWLPIK